MADKTMNPKVDEFLDNARQWKEEYGKLRMIVLDCPLTEELKWGVPCYTYNGANVVLIHGFKEYCAVLFVKGSLLRDTHGILIQQTANVQAGRQIRFTNVQEIVALEATLKDYIYEAIEIEKSGLEVSFKKSAEFAMPEELLHKFAESPELKTAFEALTPGRQRAYLLHFSEPKQSKTRVARIEKYMPQILKGKGLND
ncbi:MAG: YdeI/OmpD-associated family protein [Saccharofermentanales bacterium]